MWIPPTPSADSPGIDVAVERAGYDRNVPADALDDASMTLLEHQQQQLIDPAAHTFWHRVRFDLVASAARQIHATTVLDIGAGSGMLGDYLESSQPDLTYRFDELSPLLDRQLGAHFGAGARFGAAERVSSTTVAALLDVIEHIEDPVAALRQWCDRMEPGSRLVVTVPTMQWAFSEWDTGLGHYRRYSRKRLRRCLGEAGFDVVSCDYLFPEMLPLLVKRRIVAGDPRAVDMPLLSDRMNRIGYAISSTTARCRRCWPAGTSAIAVATPAA